MRAMWTALLLACSATFAAQAATPQGAIPRDLDHDGTVDVIYDPNTDLTWTADATYAGNSGLFFPPDFRWDVFGVAGWRLPVAELIGTECGDWSPNAICGPGFIETLTVGIEYVRNLPPSGVWWLGNPKVGGRGCVSTVGITDECFFEFGLWPVHDGNVFAVPEPSTYALMVIGLAAVAFRSRKTRLTWGQHEEPLHWRDAIAGRVRSSLWR